MLLFLVFISMVFTLIGFWDFKFSFFRLYIQSSFLVPSPAFLIGVVIVLFWVKDNTDYV